MIRICKEFSVTEEAANLKTHPCGRKFFKEILQHLAKDSSKIFFFFDVCRSEMDVSRLEDENLRARKRSLAATKSDTDMKAATSRGRTVRLLYPQML